MNRRPPAASGATTAFAGSWRPDEGIAASSPIRVLIADHSDFVRQGISSILADVPEVCVVGVAATAAEAIELSLALKPGVILMDGNLPDRGGYEATRRLAANCRTSAVVMLSAFEDAEHALDAFACGAHGYLSKDVDRSELVAAIRRAAAGEISVDPVLGARLLQTLAAGASLVAARPDALTTRELDVLRLLAKGNTNKEIASGLVVAVGTVKVHVERIFGKLGTSTRSAAAVRAIQMGIVEPPEGPTGNHWDASHEPLPH